MGPVGRLALAECNRCCSSLRDHKPHRCCPNTLGGWDQNRAAIPRIRRRHHPLYRSQDRLLRHQRPPLARWRPMRGWVRLPRGANKPSPVHIRRRCSHRMFCTCGLRKHPWCSPCRPHTPHIQRPDLPLRGRCRSCSLGWCLDRKPSICRHDTSRFRIRNPFGIERSGSIRRSSERRSGACRPRSGRSGYTPRTGAAVGCTPGMALPRNHCRRDRRTVAAQPGSTRLLGCSTCSLGSMC